MTQPPLTVPQVSSTVFPAGRPLAVACTDPPTIAGVSYLRFSVATFVSVFPADVDAADVEADGEHAASNAASPAVTYRPDIGRCFMDEAGPEDLRNDCELRGLNLERLEFSSAPLRILRRHGVPNDASRRIVGHDPLGHPEFALRLLFVLAIAHRHVDRLAGVIQVNDHLGRTIALSGSGIDRIHAEADRLAALELVIEEAVLGVARRIEIDDVSEEHEMLLGLPGDGGRSQERDQEQRRTASKCFHTHKVTESGASVQMPTSVSPDPPTPGRAGPFRGRWPSRREPPR